MNDFNTGDNINNDIKTWSNFFSGLIWFVVGFIIIVITQIAAVIGLGVIEALESGVKPNEQEVQRLFEDGDIIGIAFFFATILILLLVVLVIKFRRKREVKEYLALNSKPINVFMKWLGVALIILLANYVCDILFDRPAMPEWVINTFKTVDYKFLYFLGIVVFAPILEEVLYRGYILRTWLESRLHPNLAIFLLSALWALTHLQYDLYDMFWIFVLGILLAYSRIRSGSLYPAICIHCSWNLFSYFLVSYYLG